MNDQDLLAQVKAAFVAAGWTEPVAPAPEPAPDVPVADVTQTPLSEVGAQGVPADEATEAPGV